MKSASVASLFLLCASLVASPVPASSDAGRGAPVVLRATLENGLRVILVRDPLAPVVTTVMNYEVGSTDEAITGTAHATEHMMFRGTKSLSASQFADVTAIAGGDFNADTQSRITQYFYTMPSADLDIAMRLEAARARDLSLDQAQWDQERSAIEQEVVRDNSIAGYRLGVKLQHQVLAGTPYADEGLGTLQSFGHEIQAPQLRSFYDAWYHPDNAVYVISGDIDPQATLARVRTLFGGLPAVPLPARKPVQLAPVRPATFTEVSDDPATEVDLAFRSPGYESPDFAASVILGDVLNSKRGALYGLVARGAALGAEFQTQPYPKIGMATAALEVAPNVAPRVALAELRAALNAYRKNGVPGDLVAVAKRREAAQDAFKMDSVSGIAFAWSEAVAGEHRRSPDDDVAAIARVSKADVDRVLRAWIDPTKAVVGISVPKAAGGAQHSSTLAAEHPTMEPTSHEALPAWAKSVLTNLAVPHGTLHPTAMVLPNGIHLIVQPETISPTVDLVGVIRNEPQLEAPRLPPGTEDLTAQLFSYGTQRYDRLAYQAQLDAIAANISSGTSFSLSVPREGFARGMELLAEDELHPRFASADFATVRERYLGALAGEEQSPDHQAQIALAKGLYPPNDPRRRFATAVSVGRATLGDVRSWYATAYRPDRATIVVVGDVAPAQARAEVERTFGGWQAVGAPPVVDPAPVTPAPARSTVIPATGRVQDAVRLAQTLSLRRADPDFASLQLANTVLSGGFYASLLYHDLRQVHGYVYSVGSQLQARKTRSAFLIDYGASPENVEAANALVTADLRGLMTTPLPAERLQRAKALLLGEIPLREQSYDGIAVQLLADDLLDLPLDQNLIDAQRELDATPAQVRDAVAKWLRPEGFVRVIEGPQPR